MGRIDEIVSVSVLRWAVTAKVGHMVEGSPCRGQRCLASCLLAACRLSSTGRLQPARILSGLLNDKRVPL